MQAVKCQLPLTETSTKSGLMGFINNYEVVIPLACVTLILLVVVGSLIWRMKAKGRAVNKETCQSSEIETNRESKGQEGTTSDQQELADNRSTSPYEELSENRSNTAEKSTYASLYDLNCVRSETITPSNTVCVSYPLYEDVLPPATEPESHEYENISYTYQN